MIQIPLQELVDINSLRVETKICACGCGEKIPVRNKNGELFFKFGHGRKNKHRIENLLLISHGKHSSHHRKEEIKKGKKLFRRL